MKKSESTGWRIPSRLPERLLQWYAENARDLPWRHNKDPYRVWLSEIMLQQTRVEAVIPYYHRFLKAAPDLEALADLPDEHLMKLWQGLGYYSRARNLKKAARMIRNEMAGVFPQESKEIQKLPGIGVYTAGAIASICFEEPSPAVDGNVIRVCARLTAFDGDAADEKTRTLIREGLARIYPAEGRGDFTQSLMELGAVICLPGVAAPLCEICPVADLCLARKRGDPSSFPAPVKKKARRAQAITVFVYTVQSGAGWKVALRKRPEKGLLADLWEFPNKEGKMTPQEALAEASLLGLNPSDISPLADHVHIFTHIRWEMSGYLVTCGCETGPFVWVAPQELKEGYALPAAFAPFLIVCTPDRPNI